MNGVVRSFLAGCRFGLPRLVLTVGVVLTLSVGSPSSAAEYFVPGDFSTIQVALDAAYAGDTVTVSDGVYSEKLVFPRSGNPVDGYITLRAAAGAGPILDGAGVAGSNMVLIDGRSYVRLSGFEIRNNLGVNDGSGVRVLGSGTNIEILDNEIHEIRGQHAMGITVYGTDPQPLENIVIDGNNIHDCDPAQSEALTLNGNVRAFEVTNNAVRDVNSIGIDFIGGETDIQPDPSKVAREGLCRGNVVTRANANYGGGFAGGIYVDGGRDIVIENNVVSHSDLGIEIGAENSGLVTTGIVVRNNLVYRNEKAGIVFGGFNAGVGRANGNRFLNNTCFFNDTLGEGLGELWIQYAENNEVRNNIFYSNSQNVLLYSENGNVGNELDYNLWYTDHGDASAEFVWQGVEVSGLAAYRSVSAQGANSIFADPDFVASASDDFHISSDSPARDVGDPDFSADVGETDIDGAPRVNGVRVEIGADEVTVCGDGNLDSGEACDDGNLIDGDGCDSNCTPTGCGNSIVSVGEDCDDGNGDAGDCCSPACSYEAPGSACDDGRLCTTLDTCDGTGGCSGLAQPEPACAPPFVVGKSVLLAKDKDGQDRDQLVWRWSKGPATTLQDLGDPFRATSYALCVYDTEDAGATSLLVTESVVPPGGTCSGKPCWKAVSDKGYKYKNKTAVRGGVRSVVLRRGDAGKSKFTVKAKGVHLGLPPLPLSQDPELTVNFVTSDGRCWKAVFASPASLSTPERFKDKND